jgi:hypothetical protein
VATLKPIYPLNHTAETQSALGLTSWEEIQKMPFSVILKFPSSVFTNSVNGHLIEYFFCLTKNFSSVPHPKSDET